MKHLALLLLLMGIPALAAYGDATHKIGIEGQVSLDLPRPDYRPLPLDDRTELILRIGSVTATTNGLHRYKFYYMGLEPGDYPLADYLILPDGSQPAELAGIPLQVRATLPEDHDGQLTDYLPGRFPFLGGYRMFLGALAVMWFGGIAGFVWFNRKKRAVTEPVEIEPEPSFAERLRPLVEAAATGRMSIEEKAQIERLLMAYWRERLHLPELRMAESLARLKKHTQAGALLRTLERWLHQRTGASAEEINAVLAPYRNMPAQSAGGTG